MKKLYAILMCSCLAFVAGCHNCERTQVSGNTPAFVAFASDSFYVSVENVGQDGDRIYKNSTAELGATIENSIAKHTKNVARNKEPIDFEAAKLEAKKQGAKYLVSTKIVTWKDTAMGWDTTNDKVKVITTVWNIEKDIMEESFAITSKNSIIKLDRDIICRPIQGAYDQYFDDLFRK